MLGASKAFVAVLACCLFGAPTAFAAAGDTARYILPPGNFGGLPTTQNSLDQLPLYDGLTPLRGNVTAADINRLYLPEDLKPIGEVREEPTGRPGLRLVYDSYGIPHITGKTRDDLSFGAGWVTARDRGLLISLARGASRVAVADVPGIDAFGLVTSAQSFTPSAQAEALVTEQRKLIASELGAKGRQILADAQAYVDGANAYNASKGNTANPLTINDVIATTAFIGSIFGAGGGGEAANSDLLAKLQRQLGRSKGHEAWEDVMLADDPEAPTTIKKRFDYGPITGGRVRGSVVVDPGSIDAFDPLAGKGNEASVNAAAAPARRRASNFQIVSPQRSATDNSLAVMGPQLGYYYPEIVEQMHLKGPGINAQGIGVPGLSMYLLIGRTSNYAWSLTSAGHDVRDVYAEPLCNSDGSRPSRESTGYRFKGKCRQMRNFNAGTLGGDPLKFKTTVHGSVTGTATVDGRPYALARKRSTFGRDALNLAALKDMTEGKGGTPKKFMRAANQFGFTFNWGYANRDTTANFSSGRLPVRPRGLDRRLPTLGNGKWEWKGFLDQAEHPSDVGGPDELLLNWNNRSAPGFMHGDDEPYGSVQRVELFDRFPKKVRLPDVVSVMNRAATEDVRSPVWPVVSKVLSTGKAPSDRSRRVKQILDAWVRQDAPRLDADNDTFYDSPAPAIMDAVWEPIAAAVMRPRFGKLVDDLDAVRSLNSQSGHSYVDKDLRRLLERPVRGAYNLRYCGRGKVAPCRKALWQAINRSTARLEKQLGPDPSKWLTVAARTSFVPGLIPDTTMRATNRPTFQQVLEFQSR